MAEHQVIAEQLGIDVQFRDPRHRGSNESTNRQLRQDIAAGSGPAPIPMRDLDDIAERINTRLCRLLDWVAKSSRTLLATRPRRPCLARRSLNEQNAPLQHPSSGTPAA